MQKAKNILIVVLSILVLLLLSKSYLSPGHTSGSKTGKNTPTQYTDAAGTVHTEIRPAQVVSMQELREHDQRIIDSMLRLIKAKPSSVRDITTADISTQGSFIPDYYGADTSGKIFHLSEGNYDPVLIVPADTSFINYAGKRYVEYKPADKPLRIQYSDRWISLHGSIAKDSSLHYTIYDAISAVGYEKRTGLFKSEFVVDVSSINPHSKISGLYAVRMQKKPKSWGIGITAGYVYDGQTMRPGISLGITKTLIRW